MEARKSSWASAHAQLWTSSCDEDSGARVFPLDVDCSSTVRSTDGTTGPASNALFVWAEDLRLPNRDKNTIRQLLKLMDSLLNSAHSHGVTVLENHATIFKDIALSLSESAQHTPDVDLLLQTAARSAVVDTSICDARLGAPPMRNNEHSQLINELRKVADTLEQCGYGDSTRSASENLLELVGDTEQLKRQNNLQTILCQSYEATVQRVMASYGEVLFPTIDGEKNRLAGTAPESSPVWLEEYFRQILNAMKPFDCDPGLVSPLFMGDATHIRKTIRKFTDEVLRCLSRLNNCSDFVQNHSEGSSLELRERVAMLEKALRSIMAHGSFSHIGQSSKAELSQELCDTVVNSVKGLVEEYDSTLCRIGDIDATIIPLLDVNASVPRINSASGALLSQVITVESHLSSLLESHLNLMAQKRSMENETKESVHALTQLLPYCGKPTGAVTTAASTRLQDIVGAFTERLRNGRKNYSNDKNQDRSDDSELVAYLKRKKPRIDCIFDEMLFSSSDERNEETIGTSATYSSFVETFVNQVVEKLSSLHEMFVNRGRELERLRERCSGQCSFVDAIKLRVSSTDQSVNKIVQHLGLDIGGKEQLPHDPIRNLVAAGNQQQDFAVDLLAEEQVVSLLDRVLSKLHLTELHIASTKTVESSACKSMSSGPRDPVGHSSDSSSYRETVRVVLRKLAQGGSQIKTTLFLIGSDETASDEVIDEAIKKTSQDIGALTTEGNDEVHEELLAVLLQKYSRWGQRLLEATEEHVAGQKKILKYMKGIRLFFSPSRQHDESEATRGDTLLDIDADLFRLVDTILPAIDRLTRPAESPRAGISGNGAVDSHFVRSVKESQAPASTQEHDSRLQHLYDSVVKLRNMIDALRRGRYLTIPSGAKQVRGSDEYELVFDDETDSWEGKDSGATHHQLSSPNHPLHETGSAVACRPGDNEELIKVALQNTESLCRSVLKFSANYKMAAIIIQKDTDALQQLLADLLEKYSEVDVENAFGQDREELRTLYSVLRERGTRQKGCYFFSRIGGEGKCVWNSAVQLLSTGYNVLIDRMLQNTTLLSEGQEFTARVRHLCSTYARWCQQHCDSESLSASIKRLADDGEPIERASATAKSNNHESGGYSLLSPASTGDTLSVLEHMIKCVMSSQQVLAARMQDGCSSNGMNVDVSDLARLNAEGNRSSTQIEDLWMEKRKLEQERDQALSEAAVAKAQLRRMRNSAAPDGAENQNIPASNLDEIQGSGTHSPVDSDSCPTRVEDYVRALEVEIAYARQVAEAQCPEHSTASKIDILPNRDKDPSRVFTEKKFLAYVCPNSAYENILGKNKQHVEVLANSVKPTTSMQGTPDQRTKRRPQSSASRRSDSCGKGSPTCRTENQKNLLRLRRKFVCIPPKIQFPEPCKLRRVTQHHCTMPTFEQLR